MIGHISPTAREVMALHRADLPAGWIYADKAPESRPTDWLIPDRLARGHVTYLYGEEGIGKSTWWVLQVQEVTARCEYVVLIFTEDGWEDTLRGRLECAGVDMTYVILSNVSEDGEFEPGIPGPGRMLTEDLPDISLVVVDGIADAATVARGHLPKHSEWREVFGEWARYARKKNAAVLALGHTNRDTQSGTRGAVGLSGQIRQKVRLNILAQRDEEGRLAVGVEKSNICSDAEPVDLYTIETVDMGHGVTTTIARAAGAGKLSAKKLFSVMAAQSQVAEDEAEIERLDGCVGDLVKLLDSAEQDSDGWMLATEVTLLLTTGKGPSKTRWSENKVGRARTEAIHNRYIEATHPVVPGPWYWRAADR
ncbi:AAA family ATPase [Gordonia zhaorongruii]|uniref:AAA family ATPase n=1 Tax=Gordonia zhaorongruii TaxID=2597659 RepID=UPI0016432720|nr:AAA family ATPase [Gordonia zhaorongruii]